MAHKKFPELIKLAKFSHKLFKNNLHAPFINITLFVNESNAKSKLSSNDNYLVCLVHTHTFSLMSHSFYLYLARDLNEYNFYGFNLARSITAATNAV
jgi:hypothetical protein